MTDISSVEEMKVVANNNKDVVVSYHTNIKTKVSSQAHKQHIPTRAYDEKINRIRSLALRKYGKMKGAFFDITDEALEIGLTEIENKLQQTTSYAISGRSEYRADKVDRLMRIKTLLKVWDTDNSSSSYPVFHINTLHDVIKQVLGVVDNRTHDKYFKIIIKLCGNEVTTSRFDITGFMQHEFRS